MHDMQATLLGSPVRESRTSMFLIGGFESMIDGPSDGVSLVALEAFFGTLVHQKAHIGEGQMSGCVPRSAVKSTTESLVRVWGCYSPAVSSRNIVPASSNIRSIRI